MIQLIETDFHILNMHTRMPFRYGIAEMTALPHLFVRVLLDVNGKEQWGIASEGLPPKWFTKDPKTTYQEDVAQMRRVIRQASTFGLEMGSNHTLFLLAMQLYWAQYDWGEAHEIPALLSNLGVSLIERAMIDAFCRAEGVSFFDAVQQDRFGIHLGVMSSELEGVQPADLLPKAPLSSLIVRHTIGFGDPLTDGEIPPEERLDDGLPQSLEASIRAYGLTHFKIKINGHIEEDVDRLRRIGRVLAKSGVRRYRFTLDGNEQFKSVDHFATFWQAVTASGDLALSAMLRHLLFVEQPFHREIALTPKLGQDLTMWDARPPIIIDESDGELISLPTALLTGYVGTSHKNCKGVFKSVANRCLITKRQADDPAGTYIMSGEDLANVGPVALQQDLATLATLGIPHAERNGHHYFRGLSALPADIQQQAFTHHSDLYRPHADGFPTLNIANGTINLTSIVQAPYGLAFELDPTRFTPLDEWRFEGMNKMTR